MDKGHAESSFDMIIELQRKVADLTGRLKSERLPFEVHSLVGEIEKLRERLTIGPNQAVVLACREADRKGRDAMIAALAR